MTYTQKKLYILKFVAQGIAPHKAYQAAYCTAEEITKAEKDKKLQAEIADLLLKLKVKWIADYNDVVEEEGRPSDHLKRLAALTPDVVSPEDAADSIVNAPVQIIKQRG